MRAQVCLTWPQSSPGLSLPSQCEGDILGRVLHSALLHSQGVAQLSARLLYQNIQLSGLEGKGFVTVTNPENVSL